MHGLHLSAGWLCAVRPGGGEGSHCCLGTRESHGHIPRLSHGDTRTCQQLRALGSQNTDHSPGAGRADFLKQIILGF